MSVQGQEPVRGRNVDMVDGGEGDGGGVEEWTMEALIDIRSSGFSLSVSQ